LRQQIDAAQNLTNAIIFCNRKRDVATLARSLEKHGYSVGALHGDMDQHSRLKTLDGFRDNKITLLVASDVAARGLDIPTVSHVFNFDVPSHAEDYVHRIGRTGRAGRSGEAITIATGADKKYVAAIEKLIGQDIKTAEGGAPAEDHSDGDGHGDGKTERKSRRGDKRRDKRASGEKSERKSGKSEDRKPKSDDTEKQQSRKASGAKSDDDGEKKQRKKDRGGERVGFGDQAPAFLLRPVRLPKATETVGDN
jgi:superfamily II DNA/RNA helicase